VKVFSGSSNLPLAEAICAYIGIDLGKSTIKPFPDGETFVKIEENVRGEDVFVVQSTSPPTNHHLMEMFIMIDALRRRARRGSRRCCRSTATRGRTARTSRECPSPRSWWQPAGGGGANRILTMDLHAQQIQGFFDIPVDHLYAAPVMYEYLKNKRLRDLVVVSPDIGGLKMAYAYSQVLGAALAIVAKRRKSASEVESMAVIGEIRGKDALLVDDLTETAGTLTTAAALIKQKGAKKILACVPMPFSTRWEWKDCENRLLTNW